MADGTRAAQSGTKREKWKDTAHERSETERMSDAYAAELDNLAIEQARRREPVSTRWQLDVQQFKGIYTETIRRELEKNPGASKLFVNITRPKCRILTARLLDILYPTDDSNWEVELKPAMEDEVVERHPEVMDPQMAEGVARRKTAEQMVTEAATRVMRDQLEETQYDEVGRQVLDQGVKLGLGVAKGPVHGYRRKRRWKGSGGDENGGRKKYELVYEKDERPSFEWVDAFNWFPDMDATKLESCDFIFELHRLSAREVRALAKRPDFFEDNIRDVLNQGPMYESFVDYVNDLRDVETPIVKASENRYFVWEYHGPIPYEKLEMLSDVHGREEIMDAYGRGGDDPIDVIDGVVWFCQGRIFKFGPHSLDSGEFLYSTFRIDPDESTLFGDGVPAMIRDPQRALNAAWRIMMQNGALAGLPMFVVDRSLKPVDGKMEVRAGKIWEREHAQETAGIQAVDVSGNTDELVRIIEMSMTFAEQESNLPLIAQGEQSGGGAGDKTAHGMNLLANAVNVIFRNAARSFDWDFTEPNLRRLYDWNMQFNDDEAIKGDGEMLVKARGSSVLLVRDVQAQNLMMILNLAAQNPMLGQLLKIEAVARRLFQALQLSKDEMVMSDAEWQQFQQQLQEQGNPEAEIKMQIEQMKLEGQMMLAEMNMKTEMLRLASQENMTVAKIQADLEKVTIQSAHKERLTAAEMSIKKDLGTGI